MAKPVIKQHDAQPILFALDTDTLAETAKPEARQAEIDSRFDSATLRPENNPKHILTVLESLGRLPPTFDGNLFLPLLQHHNEDIRRLTVKNLGKLESPIYLQPLSDLARSEENTLVRRETLSAIGRMRNTNAIPILEHFLKDADAKVVLQAIRGLLVFRDQPDVQKALESLHDHPNEHIRGIILTEFGEKKRRKAKNPEHSASPVFLRNVIVQGDVREVLPLIPAESLHLTVTSPPYYNAKDYQLYRSYEEYLQFLVGVFTEVHRATKEGRFLALNTSPVIEPRMGRQYASKRYLIPFDIHPRLTQIGWEFIEDIVWAKPAPSAKNRNGGFFQHRKPLAYKTNSVTEYVLVYRKKTDKLIDWNIDQYSDAAIEASKVVTDYEKTNLWQIAPANDKVHPAVFPKELVSRLIQFYAMKGDLVFDPFGGIGTVGQVALATDRYFLLAEQDASYVERAMALIRSVPHFDTTGVGSLELAEFKQKIQGNI